MKKLFIIAFTLMFSFNSVYAGDDHHTPELARDTEPDTGNGNDSNTIYNLFISKCNITYIYISNRLLTNAEYNYLQGWYDAQCDKQKWQTA